VPARLARLIDTSFCLGSNPQTGELLLVWRPINTDSIRNIVRPAGPVFAMVNRLADQSPQPPEKQP
jgi:hypothetical protein